MIHVLHNKYFLSTLRHPYLRCALDTPSQWDHVATVYSNDPNVAFELTQHLDSNWAEGTPYAHNNPLVIAHVPADKVRSTSPGDILVVRDDANVENFLGEVLVVTEVGFQPAADFTAWQVEQKRRERS